MLNLLIIKLAKRSSKYDPDEWRAIFQCSLPLRQVKVRGVPSAWRPSFLYFNSDFIPLPATKLLPTYEEKYTSLHYTVCLDSSEQKMHSVAVRAGKFELRGGNEKDIVCTSLTLPAIISLLIIDTYQTALKFRFPSYLDLIGGKVGEHMCSTTPTYSNTDWLCAVTIVWCKHLERGLWQAFFLHLYIQHFKYMAVFHLVIYTVLSWAISPFSAGSPCLSDLSPVQHSRVIQSATGNQWRYCRIYTRLTKRSSGPPITAAVKVGAVDEQAERLAVWGGTCKVDSCKHQRIHKALHSFF